MNTSVEHYFMNGCGRCDRGGTPDCKVHQWQDELKLLREIVNQHECVEESKWGSPCYTVQGKNVLMISALNDYCCISFFKGSLLSDPKNLLEKPGPHSQAARLYKFTSTDRIRLIQDDINSSILEAIKLEKSGAQVQFKKEPEPLPDEMLTKFDEDPVLKSAFYALTPGRQRGFILHISQAKQSKTRMTRLEKCTPMIMEGIGLHDKYKSMK